MKDIYLDEIVKEIIDEEIELEYYELVWEVKKIYNILLPDIYYKYQLKSSDYEPETYYTIKEFIQKYIVGKKYYDIYWDPKDGKRDNYTLSTEYDESRIYKQIQDICGISNTKFEGAMIPKHDIDNILILLKYYQHDVQKKIRTNRLGMLDYDNLKEYVDLIRQERKKIGREGNQEIEYLLEKTFNLKLYNEISNTYQYAKDIMSSDLSTLSRIKNLNLRLEYVKMYKELFSEFTLKWRQQVEAINNISDKVIKEVEEQQIDANIEGESLNILLRCNHNILNDFMDSLFKQEYTEKFSKSTFKEIMIETQEMNNRITQVKKES